ncbi:Angiotensin-converting enzyme [Portunus trituberculatus]|uniref:Angiotensin-converting enzyme n=1 Tax=Portunus trituberculatus TaxID=210409 RepID=A0A5B7JE57_PORTR|nr:Angiotensin-converting enzyme [Portunus trituberculatus]
MCAKVHMKDLLSIHHELGHIHYYLQYNHLPLVFRKGANQGFHEALGDTVIMSVGTPRHLQRVGLLKEVEEDNELEMNYLLRVALRWVPLLHFAYVLDLWRWELQGLKPPVVRTEKDFDPAAKYHVVADVEYIR